MAKIVQFPNTPEARALYRMLVLDKKHGAGQAHKHMSREEYHLAENEFIMRSGDPDRYDERTGNWIIWP